MKHLIIETQQNELDVDIKENGPITLGGIFSQWDVLNNNKRIYKKEPLLREVDKLQGVLKVGRLLGELDHPPSPRINLDRVSHKITDLQIDESNKNVIGKLELLNTPNGKIAKAIVDSGTKLAISSRATGELKSNGDGTYTVGEDFNLLTYDLVLNPGVENAILGMTKEEASDYIVLTQEEYSMLREGKFNLQMEKEIKERLRRVREDRLIRAVKKILQ